MRPLYETPEQRTEEMRIAAILQRAWNCQVVKLPIVYKLDYACMRDGVIRSWLEIKRRDNDDVLYDEVILSLHKVFAAREFYGYTGLPCLFAVQWNNRLAFANILEKEWPVGWGGRSDRGDWQDQEPVVLIPLKMFVTVVT